MNTTAQRFHVPPGFSGHWCTRCEKGIEGIPEEAGSPAKCPKCRHWTVWYIPLGLGEGPEALGDRPPAQPASKRELAGEKRVLSAGAEWQRKQPTTDRAKELFQHMKAVVDQPGLNPDLNEIEDEQNKR